jgi:hypothetical protein
MKSFIIFILALCLAAEGFSQSIGIGTTTPNNSAILDVSSINKGFLFPRMTYVERTLIPSPAQGLIVYQTNAVGLLYPSGIYFFDGSLWKRIARTDELGGGGGSTGWTIAGDNQYSNLVGNVGIGTSSPTSKFHLVGNMLTESGSITINNPTAILQLQSAGVNKGFMQLSGNNVRIGTNSGNAGGKFIIRMNGLEHVTIDSTGYVGIGTTTPETQLQVDGPGYVSYTTNGLFQIGSVNEINTVFGRNEILARSSGNPTALYLQQNGGKIYIGGAGESNENPKVHIRDGSHASYVTDGQLLIGETDGLNLAIGHYEILARDNGVASPLYLQQEGGAVRLGGSGLTASGTKLHITDGANAGLATHGYFLLGLTSDENIVMDNNNIQARDNGVATYLKVQQSGGPGMQIGFFNTASHPLTKLYIPSGDDAGISSDGYIHLGLINSSNLILDNNEIMARNDGSLSTLYLQNDGGSVQIGAHTTINTGGNGEVLRLDGVNPNIGFYQSGVYRSFLSQSGTELFMGVNGGKMHLDATQIAIGTTSSVADAYKLTVSGKILCEELKVELYAAWPDYVFHDEYQLRSIHELKSFISDNNHLPNIPKASEVAEKGFEVGEMNRKLLEKVEELTLYVIQLQEQIDELKKELD